MASHPEDVMPYGAEGSKGRQVEAMFDSIAPSYDFMNTAMSFGMHRHWLRKALGAAAVDGARDIVDLASGTGEVAFRLAELYPHANITGVDLSEGMLAVAREKLKERGGEGGRLRFIQGDCLNLPFPDNAFDLLTIAYGVRNFEDLRKGIREFHRILRPEGKCMILELSRPENRLVRMGYDLYSRTLIPAMGRLVSKDSRAYSYLPESIAAMPPRKAIEEMILGEGFASVVSKPMTMGTVTYFIARK